MPDAKELIRRWFREVWNEGRPDAVDAMMLPDAQTHGIDDAGPVDGPEGFKPFQRALRGAFPDIRFELEELIAEGDKCVARWVATLTHLGSVGGVPATLRKARVTGIMIARIREGKIAELWNNWDASGMLKQLGLISSDIPF